MVSIGSNAWSVMFKNSSNTNGKGHIIFDTELTDRLAQSQPRINGRPKAAKVSLAGPAKCSNKFVPISYFLNVIIHSSTNSASSTSISSSVKSTSIISASRISIKSDLTDAKTADMLGSRQYIEEWETYRNILETTGVLNVTTWLDIRGNHDNFNVPSLTSPSNYYQHYSVQGRHHKRSYMHTYTQGNDSVAFIAVDACLLPGPRRPFNFVGLLTSSELQLLESFAAKAKANHNYTIWFGHYPTSCILAPEPGIRQVMSGGLAYMCGHLHTLHGLATHMYTRQQTGALELELGDWKDGRYFRVAAIDHGLFSFVDVKFNVWPVILVTNPKHALFTMPTHEPTHRMATSTHIRVLLWSLSAIVEARIRLDDTGSWMELTHIEGPLYVTAWNPKKYSQGLHVLEVFARDAGGRENSISQPFSLDLSQPGFALWPRVLLMSNISMVFQFLFGMAICFIVIPLCILRYIHRLVVTGRMNRPRLPRWSRLCCCEAWLRKIWILVSVDRLFWPIIISTLYYPLGPWMVGEVLENHIGIIFAWGTFVNHSYLPGSLTYAYVFFQMMTFHIPLILALSHCVDVRYSSFYVDSTVGVARYFFRHVAVLAVITLQILLIYFFWLAYGTIGLFLGPLRTWAAILGTCLWYFAATLPKDKLR
ncbi:unnamed protein product, partial [Meganyctiphanes norvegica]